LDLFSLHIDNMVSATILVNLAVFATVSIAVGKRWHQSPLAVCPLTDLSSRHPSAMPV